MKDRRRRKKRVRERDWHPGDHDALQHERKRLRGLDVGLGPEAVPIEERFTDIEPNGVVVSPYGVLAFVECDGEEKLCRVGEALCVGKTSILAPGDAVFVEPDEDGFVVSAVRKRRSKLSRPAIRGVREHVLAANVDLLVVVAAVAKPRLKAGLLDRYLIAAEIGGVSTVIVFSKMDLVDEEPEAAQTYRELGAQVICASCVTGMGIDEIDRTLAGKRAIFTGQSGVGKSTIINCLSPELDLETREVSRFNEKGRHTTTTSRLYRIGHNTEVIDTPGIKQLGLWGVSVEEIAYYFPEMGALADQCRFRDCTHLHEPDCAVRAAVEAGDIAPSRYESYQRIRESL